MLTLSSTSANLPLAVSAATATAAATTNLQTETPDTTVDLVEASTQLTLGTLDALTAIYTKPSAKDQQFEQPRAWASPPNDAISQRMQSNLLYTSQGLAASWRGIGGDLLSRFKTTQTDYFQTVADYWPVSSTHHIDANGALQGSDRTTTGIQALAMVEDGAHNASLHIRTRSGQTVDIKISVDSKESPVSRGLHAKVHTSGNLTTAERDALAQLSYGLDKALEGLGTYRTLKLDVSGLLKYDKSVLSQVDLTVTGPHADVPAALFELHLNDLQQKIALQGQAGKMAISVNTLIPSGTLDKQQQQDSIRKYLAQFDAEAARGHANLVLVAQFKDAFTDMHSAASSPGTPTGPTAFSKNVQAQMQPLLSGLNDFQASLGGDFDNGRIDHYATEAGHIEYQATQTTDIKNENSAGAASVQQTLKTQIQTDYKHSRGGAMLNVKKGNYDKFHIQDSSTAVTSVDVQNHAIRSAVKQTLVKQLLNFEKIVNHRVAEKSSTPGTNMQIENLR